MKTKILVSLAVLLISPIAFPISYAESQSFLCSAEESTGYDYTNGRWLRERFRPDARYMVKNDDSKWSVYEYDIEYEHTACELADEQVVHCDASGDFILNIKTMKFSVTNTEPYVHSETRNRDSVVLTLGACVSM